MPALIELEIPPQGTLARGSLPIDLPAPCSVCGRVGVKRPAQLVLDADSVARTASIFRLRNLTTAVIVTERALDALTALGLTGFIATEVPVE